MHVTNTLKFSNFDALSNLFGEMSKVIIFPMKFDI